MFRIIEILIKIDSTYHQRVSLNSNNFIAPPNSNFCKESFSFSTKYNLQQHQITKISSRKRPTTQLLTFLTPSFPDHNFMRNWI